MRTSRRQHDPFLCSRRQRLVWHLTAPALRVTLAIAVFVAIAIGVGAVLGSGPMRVVQSVPGPTVTVTIAPAAP